MKRLGASALVVAALLLVAVPASASVRFTKQRFAATFSPFPDRVATADVDGDRNRDLAAISMDGTYSVLRGDGHGLFGAPLSGGFTGASAVSLAFGDLNGDRFVDLAVGTGKSGAKSGDLLQLMRGDGSGNFQQFLPVDVPTDPESVAVADLDGDGDQDVVTANSTAHSVTAVESRGGGRFRDGREVGTLNIPSGLAVADLDDRGGLDLVASGSSEIVALLNPLKGPARRVVLADGGDRVAVGDLNGDGRTDVVATQGVKDRVRVVLSGGAGRFLPAQSFRTADSPTGVAVADFDSDGHPDVVVGASSARVHRGAGDGRLGRGRRVARFGGDSIVATDLDNDGKADLAIGDGVSRGVEVALNRTPPTVHGFTLLDRRFRVDQQNAFAFDLSTAARVRISIYRHRRRLGTLKRTGRAGHNEVLFDGRIADRALRVGRYVAALRATDAAGDTSGRRRVRFKIVR